MRIHQARHMIRQRLQDVGVASPEADASWLLAALTGLTPGEQVAAREASLNRAQMATLETWLRRREAREPLQHILGTTEFFGLPLEVTPAAMVPRPETETLAALGLTVLETLDPGGGRVLDLGTGGGAVALAIKHHRPTAEVMATDISKAALDLARRNASRLDLEAVFIRSDLLDHPTVADFAAAADLLLANPPYLPTTDRDHVPPEVAFDPEEALYSGTDGLDHFRRLEEQATRLLRPGAVMLVELDPRNVGEAYEHARRWRKREIEEDLLGKERFLRLEK